MLDRSRSDRRLTGPNVAFTLTHLRLDPPSCYTRTSSAAITPLFFHLHDNRSRLHFDRLSSHICLVDQEILLCPHFVDLNRYCQPDGSAKTTTIRIGPSCRPWRHLRFEDVFTALLRIEPHMTSVDDQSTAIIVASNIPFMVPDVLSQRTAAHVTSVHKRVNAQPTPDNFHHVLMTSISFLPVVAPTLRLLTASLQMFHFCRLSV